MKHCAIALLLLCAACHPQAGQVLVLDLAMSDPALLEGTARPWHDAGFTVEYRRFYPHLTKADLSRYRVLLFLLGRGPEVPSDALTAGDSGDAERMGAAGRGGRAGICGGWRGVARSLDGQPVARVTRSGHRDRRPSAPGLRRPGGPATGTAMGRRTTGGQRSTGGDLRSVSPGSQSRVEGQASGAGTGRREPGHGVAARQGRSAYPPRPHRRRKPHRRRTGRRDQSKRAGDARAAEPGDDDAAASTRGPARDRRLPHRAGTLDPAPRGMGPCAPERPSGSSDPHGRPRSGGAATSPQ